MLNHEISRFVIHKNAIYFQKIGSYNVHKKSLDNRCDEEVILSPYNYFNWDIKGSSLFYLSPTKGTATQMLNRLDLNSK